jgi:hypothetical protein
MIMGVVMCLSSAVSALSRTYFDDAGEDTGDCDVGEPGRGAQSNYNANYCDDEHRVVLLAGENTKIPKERTVLQANFRTNGPAPTGQSIIIRGAHLCAANPGAVAANRRDAVINGYYSDNTNDTPNTTKTDTLEGVNVTLYQIGATGKEREGKFRRPMSDDCTTTPNITVGLDPADFQPVAGVPGWWSVTIRATHINQRGANLAACVDEGSNTGTGGPCDGLVNSFKVSAVGSQARTVTSYSTGQNCGVGDCVSLRSAKGTDSDDYQHHLTYKLRFGSDCSVPAGGVQKEINFYDLDFGVDTDGGIHRVKFTIQEVTPDPTSPGDTITKWWWPTAPEWRTQRPSYTEAFMPQPRNADTSRIQFTANKDAKYVAYIMNIGPHLAFQAGLPFDGVYYNITCPSTAITPEVGLLSNGNFEPGSSVTAQAYVNQSIAAPSSSQYDRIFWYETGTLDSIYNDPTNPTDNDVRIQQLLNAPGSYPSTSNNLGDWAPYTIPDDPRFTHVCTSLFLKNAGVGTTIGTPARDVACEVIAKTPYFRVTNGDVNATAAWSPSCGSSNGRISASNLGSENTYKGSGTQIAAFSWSTIRDFTTANNGTTTDPDDLAFANTEGALYGGNFRQVYCISDELAGVVATGHRNTNCAATTNITTTDSVFISGSGPTGNGDCSVVTGTIGVGNVPGLRKVVAGGNIYINKNITNLDGIFIAKGDIYTCSDPPPVAGQSAVPVQLANIFTQCNRQLTIRGALVAGGNVKLLRTIGSLSFGPVAETIEYNPFVWMSAINPPSGGGAIVEKKFDYITALPPVL